MNFNLLKSNEKTFDSLIKAFKDNKLHHANLLTSTRGGGKNNLAFAIAQFIASQNYNEPNVSKDITVTNLDPFNHCKYNFANITYIQSESEKSDLISIEQIRKLNFDIALTKSNSQNHAVIISYIDNLTIEAQNSLLKTLEEPTDNTYFFLLQNSNTYLAPTIISRCISYKIQKKDLDLLNIKSDLLDCFESNLLNIAQLGIEECEQRLDILEMILLDIKIMEKNILKIVDKVLSHDLCQVLINKIYKQLLNTLLHENITDQRLEQSKAIEESINSYSRSKRQNINEELFLIDLLGNYRKLINL